MIAELSLVKLAYEMEDFKVPYHKIYAVTVSFAMIYFFRYIL